MSVPTDPEASTNATPNWLVEARRTYVLRVTDWFVQSWALTRNPARFANEWAAGTRTTLNPVRFLAVGGAVYYLVDRATRLAIHAPVLPSYSSYFRQLYLLLFAGVIHLMLKLRSHAPFRATLGAVAFSMGGSSVWFKIAGSSVTFAWFRIAGSVPNFGSAPELASPAPLVVAYFFSVAWTALAVMGAHRLRALWAAVVVAVAVAGVVAVAFLARGLVAVGHLLITFS